MEKSRTNGRFSLTELVQLALICALMFAGKEALRLVPNVHPVALLILFSVIFYGWKTLLPVWVFVFLEIAIYGLGMWTVLYLYIWPLLVVIAMPLRNSRSWLLWAIVSGAYGLAFGALCEIPYLFIIGPKAAFGYWIAGIPYDVVHCVSNFFLTLVLLPLLCRLGEKLIRRT